MTIEVRPLGVRCNIACQYCYQNPQRDAGNLGRSYDMEAMKKAILEEGAAFSLFGGEPLLVPLRDLEELWALGLEKFGNNGIQTNGSLIGDEHIRLFKRYRVHVGISIDGPGELNDARWNGTLERTREATAATERAIERLCAEGSPPSIITTLHRGNATPDKLPLMRNWMLELDRMGVSSARLHILETEIESVRAKYALTTEENLTAFRFFHRLEAELPRMKFDLFKDMRSLLQGKDHSTTCVWRACDPFTTSAVRGIEGLGQRSNCGRTNKDGIDFVKADEAGYERYVALYLTPQDDGGCAGCRFFLMCKGQCPGTSVMGDWRFRTEHCGVWKDLYRQLESEMLDAGSEPISAQAATRKALEAHHLEEWAAGRNATMEAALAALSGKATGVTAAGHGDHTDHGDAPHGDHTDFGS